MKTRIARLLGLVATLSLLGGCGARSAIDACLGSGGSYDYQFAECDRQGDRPGPHSACLRDLPGRWVVEGNIAPGISALSDEEAASWDGAVLSLDRQHVSFGEYGCTSPRFETKEVSRTDFEEEFRVSGQVLGLSRDAVCSTRISCEDASPFPGSLLLHAEDHLLLFWDGVYFRVWRR